MKNKMIFGLVAGLMVASTFLVRVPVSASARETIISPQLENFDKSYLQTGDGKQLTNIPFNVTCKDNSNISFSINNSNEYEKVFAVVIDQIKNTIIDKRICTKMVVHGLDGKTSYDYGIENFSLPHYCDKVDVHYYKQNSGDSDYTIRTENFLGRGKIFMPNILNYQRGMGTPLTVYDKNWDVVENKGESFLSRITPNYYTIQDTYGINDASYIETNKEKIGKIVLPQGQENLMTEDEKIIPAKLFRKYGVSGYNSTNFDFYIPNGVTEFKFVVYRNKISDNVDDILYQYHIKLNRK